MFYILRIRFTRKRLLLSAAVASAQSPQAPNVFQSNPDTLVQIHQDWQSGKHSKAVQKLLKKAQRDLDDGPYTIVNKKHPLSGVDVHEYVSVGPYDWPNPDTADGLPYIRKDGVHCPDVEEFDVRPLSEMAEHAYTLALAGYVSGDRTYSDRAGLLIRHSARSATRMNPDMEHAANDSRGKYGAACRAAGRRRFLDVIDAIGLLEAHLAIWTQTDGAAVRQWFTSLSTGCKTEI